jgi:hypothetical protein
MIVPIFRLIGLVVRGVLGLRANSQPQMTYQPGLKEYDKTYFDEYYIYQFYKFPLRDMPIDIEYYHANIERMSLVRKGSSNHFEIYETNVLSDKMLVMNVRMVYSDLIMTGLQSRKDTIITRNEYFVLAINDKLGLFQVRSSVDTDSTDKTIKSDFGELLIRYLINEKKKAEENNALQNNEVLPNQD